MNDPSELFTRSYALPGYLMEALRRQAVKERRSVNQQLRVILEESLKAPRQLPDMYPK